MNSCFASLLNTSNNFSRMVINEKKKFKVMITTCLWNYPHCELYEFARRNIEAETFDLRENIGKLWVEAFGLKSWCYFSFSSPTVSIVFIHMELNNCLNLQHKFSFWCDTKIITQLVGNSETSDSGRKSNFGLDEKCFVINKRKKNLHTERDVGSIAIKFQTLIVVCETPKCADVFRTCFLKFIFPSHIQKLCQICPSL